MKLFVWDFHGVLEMDNEYGVVEVSNIILEKYGYKERFKKSDSQKLYGFKWFQYFEYLLPKEPKSKHLELETACVELERKDPSYIQKHIKPTPNSHKVLENIYKIHDQILISNMHDTALKTFMDAVEINQYFPKGKAFATNSQNKMQVTTKKDVLKNYLQGKTFENIIIIGDSPGDIDLKSVAGGTTYLYCHKGLEFKNCYPDYKINDLREILREV